MKYSIVVMGLLINMISTLAIAQFDPTPTWPLCGRIADNAPAGWSAAQGCPANRQGNPAFTDYPISSTYGPRALVSGNYRYDFHRGIDIATEVGTPVFAIADGVIKIAGDHAAYSDPLVQIQHLRPGANSCRAGGGCYYSNSMHLSAVTVAAKDTVSKGDLIGYTGVSSSGFAHLHFEIRNANPNDLYSRWQRDAIHPLRVLPYAGHGSAISTLEINAVDSLPGHRFRPALRFSQPTSAQRMDLVAIGVRAYRFDFITAAYREIEQPGNTPNSEGYRVNPTEFDFEQSNFAYSHKDSQTFPWSSFATCPYALNHGLHYDGGVHMDRAMSSNERVGEFNNHRATPQHTNSSSTQYRLDLTVLEVQGDVVLGGLNTCLIASAQDASGSVITAQWGQCDLDVLGEDPPLHLPGPLLSIAPPMFDGE